MLNTHTNPSAMKIHYMVQTYRKPKCNLEENISIPIINSTNYMYYVAHRNLVFMLLFAGSYTIYVGKSHFLTLKEKRASFEKVYSYEMRN